MHNKDLISFWSIVPIFLKPDALEGEFTEVSGDTAADFAGYFAAALVDWHASSYIPILPSSKKGALRAKEHAGGEMRAIPWYKYPVLDAEDCYERLMQLHERWKHSSKIAIAEVVSSACQALGFHIVHSLDRVVTEADYMAFYGDTDQPDMHPKMTKYLLFKPIQLLLLCGKQENSALQLMKVFARYIMKFAEQPYSIENWIHVTNPDASNYHHLLAMFFEQEEYQRQRARGHQ